jgi:hypothetical protein
MNDIRGLSSEERVHKLVLETSLRHSVLGQYHQESGVMTDEDLHEIFSKIEHRTYYTTDMPTFEIVEIINNRVSSKMMQCGTIVGRTKEELIDYVLKNAEDKYFIYYHTSLNENADYSIRGVFVDDPVMKRDQKINTILGE